uniref:Acetylglutamate kinase n=1 Tax=Dipterocladia arabiensis TaxID=2007176 RepID=A0A1Z1M096_9FLOR|nr:acetylglutamate kinase [Dipterocladia arabiensis]ARW59457.1 acetylglutamate kinase [Dipterocladia arabiensis]
MLKNVDFDRFAFVSDFLPILQHYIGRVFVIKYGGSVMKDEFLKSKVIEDLSFLHLLGIKIILVHGGGPFINQWLTKLNIKPVFNQGIRVTDESTMEIVEMVLAGKVNKNLVDLLNNKGILSIGLSGKDSNLIVASSLFNSSENLVGKIDHINHQILKILLNNNYIPVIASIGSGLDGKTYNINADTVAGSLAESLQADKLILLTDTPGVMYDINDSSTLIKTLNVDDVQKLQKDLVISGGMIPKVECCIKALKANVKSTHIIDGKVQHALLYELLTLDRIGSMITL